MCKGGGHAIHMFKSQWSTEELLSVTFDPVGSMNAVMGNIPPKKFYAVMEMAGKQIEMQIDTGASCNVLLQKCLLEHPSKRLTLSENVQTMAVIGTCKLSTYKPRWGEGGGEDPGNEDASSPLGSCTDCGIVGRAENEARDKTSYQEGKGGLQRMLLRLQYLPGDLCCP